MTDTLNLLPCPFCGSSNVFTESQGGVAFVQCDDCAVEGSPRDTRAEAVEAWNRRASPAAAVPEGALPPLPEPCKLTLPTGWIRYTAEQMQAYARAAVEADRARQQDMSVRLAGAPASQQGASMSVLTQSRVIELFDDEFGLQDLEVTDHDIMAFALNIEDEVCKQLVARRCRAQGGMTKDNDNFRAPISTTPTSGEVEKAGWKWVPVEPTDEMREACRVLNYCDDIDAEWARMLAAAPSHPSEAKAGEKNYA